MAAATIMDFAQFREMSIFITFHVYNVIPQSFPDTIGPRFHKLQRFVHLVAWAGKFLFVTQSKPADASNNALGVIAH
jgi:hypothetical protein